MQLNPYLLFNGQCEAAFKFYEKCLGGKIVAKVTHGESPMAKDTPRNGTIRSFMFVSWWGTTLCRGSGFVAVNLMLVTVPCTATKSSFLGCGVTLGLGRKPFLQVPLGQGYVWQRYRSPRSRLAG